MKVGYAVVMVVVLTVLSGLWQGALTHRWGEPPAMLAAARAMEQVPEKFGDWRLQSSGALDKTALTQLECAGHFVRNYANRRTGELIGVTLIVGPAGPTSVHLPEICLANRNYTNCGHRHSMAVRDSEGHKSQFWVSDFQSTGIGGDRLRVCYGWSTGGDWTAPEDARFAFAGSPYLYKLQVSTVLHVGEDAEKDSAISRFLQDFVDESKRCIVSSPRS